MTRIYLFFLVLPYLCSGQATHKASYLDSLLRSHLVHKGKQPVHNLMVYAKNGQTGEELHSGEGIVGRNEVPIDPDYQFKVASITKTVVAVLILQLMEEGKLTLQDRAGQYLAQRPELRFDALHYLGDTAYAKDITIEHLLQHRSGLADIFSDASTRFQISVLLHKKREYDVPRIMDLYYRYKLNKQAHFQPGQGYYYSDMNFMLLGMVVEELTGQSLPQAIRERVLQPLNLQDTYFEYYEARRGRGRMIDTYLNRINITRKINTSYEWGGGGLVSTTAELATFIRAVFELRLFERPATLQRMLDISATQDYGAHYGLGIFQFQIDDLRLYGHGGYYGSLMLHDPDHDITIVANAGQSNLPFDARSVVRQTHALLRE